jgi:sugar lactone lactonase YvrE
MKINSFTNTLILFLSGISFASNSQTITTFAGNGYSYGGFGGFSGDGGQATAAELDFPMAVAFDASGNVYIADVDNDRIREVSPSGIITNIAGNGYAAPIAGDYSGDGGPATAAEMDYEQGVALDTVGNLYIADEETNRIRKVSPVGVITTFAGNGYGYPYAGSYSGDGGPATAAELHWPVSVLVDEVGKVYIADYYNDRIRVVDTSGNISTFAGNGFSSYSGDGGPATAAEIKDPRGILKDRSGNFYFGDSYNNRVRVINSSGIIQTIAGNGTANYSGDGGPATAAELNNPSGVALDAAGNLYIADEANNRIRIVNTSGVINTFAGNGIQGYSGDGGPATAAEFHSPYGIAFDSYGNFYINDSWNYRVRKIGSVSTQTSSITPLSNEITIYPVPNTGLFTISGISKGQIIELYNYAGQLIGKNISENNIAKFDISNYPNGIYLIRVLNKDGSIATMKKVVKTE